MNDFFVILFGIVFGLSGATFVVVTAIMLIRKWHQWLFKAFKLTGPYD